MQHRDQHGVQVEVALVGSSNDAAERLLRVSAPPGAIAAPPFPRDHRRPDRVFRPPIGRVDSSKDGSRDPTPSVMPESSPTYKMHRRSPVRIGFCVSFPVGSVLALGSMISTQAMPGVIVVFLYLAVVWFVLYAACGALPYLAAGAEKRVVAAAFWGFGIGGAAAGELVAILVMSDNLASHARVLGAFAIPATIPWLLGFFMARWLAAGWA